MRERPIKIGLTVIASILICVGIVYASTITTILGTDTITSSRAVINTNFSNLNTDKLEKSGGTLTGNLIGTGASFSAGEFTSYASASNIYAGNLTITGSCTGCGTSFAGLLMGEGATTKTHITSLTYDAGGFNLSPVASGATLKIDYVNGPASRSATNTWTALNTFSVSPLSLQFVTASGSGNLEIVGYASASQYFSGGLGTCNSGSFLQWASGLFGCNSPAALPLFASKGLGSRVTTSSTFTHVTSLSFEGNSFTFATIASAGTVKINWGANGVASRSTANTWSANNIFSGGVSISSNFEVTGFVSSSFTGSNSFSGSMNLSKSLTVTNSVTGLTFQGTGTGSNSFAGSLNVTKSITAGGLTVSSINDTGTLLVSGLARFLNSASVSSNLEVSGTASISRTFLTSTSTTAPLIFSVQDKASFPSLTITRDDRVGIQTFSPHSILYINDPVFQGFDTAASSSFAIRSLRSISSVASISAMSLTTGNVFSVTASIAGWTGNLLQATTTSGTLIASISGTGNLEVNGFASASRLFMQDGTAAAPSIGFSSGTRATGIFRASMGIIGVSTMGVERLRINDVGSLLIGTTTNTTGTIVKVSTASFNFDGISTSANASSSFTLWGNNANTQNSWILRAGGLSGIDYDKFQIINNATPLFTIASSGHIISRQSTIPSISCTAGSPSINTGSTDVAGEFTAGLAATSCTITFATPWKVKPTCWASADSATGLAFGIQPSTTTVVFNNASLGGVAVAYGCVGYGN